ncbi:hypothetical protein EMPG_16056 [Blastomyces silverae]|uniref:Uncharacterized protein n=1 Tax=Blastomyces silverae TaxID=2060906 RepID=A0A0H1BBM2_9EURO|nr:hypothetical protein EMPG_16056 [Blastomyces silverae]
MTQRRRSRRLRTHTAGPKTVIRTKRSADSSPHDSQTPSKYLRITRSVSRYSVQQTVECGLAINDRTAGEEGWSELVDECEWKEYDELITSPTSEEKELGNRAMIKLDCELSRTVVCECLPRKPNPAPRPSRLTETEPGTSCPADGAILCRTAWLKSPGYPFNAQRTWGGITEQPARSRRQQCPGGEKRLYFLKMACETQGARRLRLGRQHLRE